jgi:hypothetical protein
MYHWVITLSWNIGATACQQTGTGTSPLAGTSRAGAYEQIYAHACRGMGAPPASTTVLFFSLEPDELH